MFVRETCRRQAGLLYKRWSELNAELELCGDRSGESCLDPCGLIVSCTIVRLRSSGGALAEFRTDYIPQQQLRYALIALNSGPKKGLHYCFEQISKISPHQSILKGRIIRKRAFRRLIRPFLNACSLYITNIPTAAGEASTNSHSRCNKSHLVWV